MRNSAALILKSCIVVLLLAGSSQAQERVDSPTGRPTGPVTIPGPNPVPTIDRATIQLPGVAQPQQPGIRTTTLGEDTDIWGRPSRQPLLGTRGSNLPPPPPPPPGPVGCPGCQPPSVFRLGQTAVFDLGATTTGSSAKAQARVLRDTSATTINLDINGLQGGEATQFIYVIDRTGEVTKVGAVKVENGKAAVNAQTKLDKFMIVVSPEDNLEVIGPTTKVSLITGVPAGFTFSQRKDEAMRKGKYGGGAGDYFNVADLYSAPVLGIQGFKLDTETKLRLVFFELSKLRGEAFITPRTTDTKVKVVITLPTDAVPGTRYVLWAVTPGKTYTRLGEAEAGSQSSELVIEAETPIKDFGLLLTTEKEPSPPLPVGTTSAVVIK